MTRISFLKIPKTTTIREIRFKYLNYIMILFSLSWVISNIAAAKMINIMGVQLTGGFFIFPMTMLFGCILAEVYGYKSARRAIWIGVFFNIGYVLIVNAVNLMANILKVQIDNDILIFLIPGKRIVLASSMSFLISEFMNCYLMAKLKIYHDGKSLLRRVIVACSASCALDITTFLTLAFYGVLSNTELFKLVCIAFVKKIACQALLFPVMLYFSKILKKLENVSICDHATNFNPFHFENVYELPINLKRYAVFNLPGARNV